MKFKVVGPRVLLKVKKFKKEDIETFENSCILRADADRHPAEAPRVA